MSCWNLILNEIIQMLMFITCSQVLLVTGNYNYCLKNRKKHPAVLNLEHLFKQTNFI